ncbi:MAG: glycoside hydrolase family 27 protein [Candidatus Marinimicrobia bacterium]|nr:glycoside hydrolase family 27 protein [Candidatus Neomarinimicrobiota bacterium]
MKKIIALILVFFVFFSCENGQLAQTPPMGWMNWNMFGGNINGQLIREMADAMVAKGMKEAGYEYIIIDDLWQGQRDENGVLHPDPEKFPKGMKDLADYVHSKGLKLGIYSDAAEYTCAGAVGSIRYEEMDARTFAEWGMDYLKYDYCGAPEHRDSAFVRYKKMADALKQTGRPMVFAICEWGPRKPWEWAADAGGQLWRTTWDIRDTWDHGKYDGGHNGIINCLDRNVDLWKYSGPGKWNDMDMLVVGLYGTGESSSHDGANGCTDMEYQSQMSLWSMLNSPLITSCDLRNISQKSLAILTNKEVIAINQDKLGKQAQRIFKENDHEIWARELEKGAWAVGFLNRNDNETLKMSLEFSKLGLESKMTVRDLWKHENVGENLDSYSCEVRPHEVVLIKLSN